MCTVYLSNIWRCAKESGLLHMFLTSPEPCVLAPAEPYLNQMMDCVTDGLPATDGWLTFLKAPWVWKSHFAHFPSLTGWHICLGNKPKIPIWLLSVIYMMPMGLRMKCSSGHSWITNRKRDPFALHIGVLGGGINVLLNRTDLHKTLMGVFRETNALKAGRRHTVNRLHGQAQRTNNQSK